MRKIKKVAACHLPIQHYYALSDLAKRNHVTISEMLRAIVVDAIVEEGFDVQRFGAEGCPPSGEIREASRPTTS